MRNMTEYDEDDFLMLSGIQHFVFCRRQWALIQLENQWNDNVHTVSGELVHENVHDKFHTEKRKDVIVTRGMPVKSRVLGISGECDAVEFHSDKNGINIQGLNGKFSVVPVEYKKGAPKEGREDILQLAAQAFCLEEMLAATIPYGFLFYFETKRRLRVPFDAEIREELVQICEEMHGYYDRGHTPKVKTSKKCNACSLKDICFPKLCHIASAQEYIKNKLQERDL